MTDAHRSNAPQRVVAAGIDGYPQGWVVAALVADTSAHAVIRLFDDISEVIAWRNAQLSSARCAIDIPIGLPDEVSFRPCDLQARERLGSRQNCVFPVPDRALLAVASYAAARDLIATRRVTVPDARSISAQSFGIVKKIAEVDTAVRWDSTLHEWLIETHPEVAFATLAGEPLPPKKSQEGIRRRLAMLTPLFPNVQVLARIAIQGDRALAIDDVLDAFASLWSAIRLVAGTHEVLGGGLNADGIPMRMVI